MNHNPFIRLLAGLAIVMLLLNIAFLILLPIIHTWGATEEEVARTYPGDDLLPQPVLRWTHAITIDAPPEETWQWIIQIGESRGGFYSYTFIENLIAGTDLYHNADHIISAYQDPPIGETIIGNMLKIRAYQKDSYLLADSKIDEIGWVWLWHLTPTADGGTRLIVRLNILPGPDVQIPSIAISFIDVGGFVMEQNMLQGIKLRAEGGSEPPYTEALEILIWLQTMFLGLRAAWLFVSRRAWPLPFSAGIDAIIILFVITFVQPSILLRIVFVAALTVQVVWVNRWTKKSDRESSPYGLPSDQYYK